MKQKILPEIEDVAKNDFRSIEEKLQKSKNIKASIDSIHFSKVNTIVTATCDFTEDGSKESIAASISYQSAPDGIYSDSEINEVSDAILAAMNEPSTIITAAEGDEDEGFMFDDMDEEPEDEIVEEDVEELDSEEEPEDPEDGPSIETDNNIAGHYIAECNRCHGVFISALMESDQHVEFLSGVCPLCEKESDQYIKWVIKPVKDEQTEVQ